jgi:phosphoenolpyruvate carboxykinase (ATP)
MTSTVGVASNFGIENHGVVNVNREYWNLPTSSLVEEAIKRREGFLSHEGPLVVRTGHHTGRSPNDKFIVRRPGEGDDIWWGDVNAEFDPACFERLRRKVLAYYQGRDLFIQDAVASAHRGYRLPIRVINQNAWQNLFARNLFIRLPHGKQQEHIPDFTILHAPGCHASPEDDNTNTEAFIILDLSKRMVLIGGTSYAGEIKKSIFTIMNYLLPKQGVLPMHCSANVGQEGDVALFFGLSGTGKTTLSSDLERGLIGDDEHGWGDDGVFNFEGGCYAKVIRLREDLEPLIWAATRRFGTILENVTVDSETRRVDFDDGSLTENTRGAYPVGFLPNHVPEGLGTHPSNIFFLTADAFGVMPPISRLTPEQAMYYFLAGYTSKLAGTERGLGSEPKATFSACFGAPFLPLHPTVYADLLGEKIARHKSNVWLVNTGWTGGPFGVGERISLPYTRAMVRAALTGQLDDAPMRKDTYFGLNVPEIVPEVPPEVLNPESTWDNKNAYKKQARMLADRFVENFKKFEGRVDPSVSETGPRPA